MDRVAESVTLSHTAVSCYDRGDYVGAVAACDHALAINPFSPEIHNTRGAALYALGDYRGAIAACSQALAREPEMITAYHTRAVARYALGDFAGAIADCDRVLARDPNVAPAHVARAAARNALGDFTMALVDCDRALTLDPRSCEALVTRGNARYHRRHPGTLRDYRDAFAINPKKSARLLVSGLADLARRSPRAAIEHCESQLRKNPDDAVQYIRRGLLLLLRDQATEAQQDFDEFLRRRPLGKGILELLVAEANAHRAQAS